MWIIKDLGNGLHIATNNSTGEVFSGTKIEVDARIAAGNLGTVTVFAKDENGNAVLAEDVSDNIVTTIKDESGNVVGLSAGVTQISGAVELSGTFSTKPAASAVTAGTMYFATDVGVSGALLRSNGTAWKRMGPVPLIHYENVAGFAATPASAEQIMTPVMFIPAGFIQPGDKLQWVAFGQDATANDAVIRQMAVRIHTAADVVSGLFSHVASISTASTSRFQLDKASVVVTATNRTLYLSANLGGGALGAATAGISAINFSVDQYVGGTVLNSATLSNFNVNFMQLILEPGS